MLPTVTVDDDTRWAEAQSVLDRRATESAQQRLAQRRRLLILAVVGGVVLGAAVSALLVVLLHEGIGRSTEHDVPVWQAVTGFVIAGAGLVVQGFAVVVQWRTNRRLQAWSSPLLVLSRAQRKELRAQVRGRAPVDADRLPLARHLAERLIAQRLAVGANLGLLVAFIGLWIAEPSWWRAVLALFLALATAAVAPFAERDARRARRFLEEHAADR